MRRLVMWGSQGREKKMSAPLNRDQQIELMQNAKTRHNAKFSGWMASAVVRRAVCQMNPDQIEGGYTRTDKQVACCA